MSKWRKYEIVLRNSETQLTKEENQKKNTVIFFNYLLLKFKKKTNKGVLRRIKINWTFAQLSLYGR
jgi:hypothetical protein